MECGRAVGSEGAGLIHILLSLHSNCVTLDWLLSFLRPLWFCLSTGNSFSSFTDATEVQRDDGGSRDGFHGQGGSKIFFPELVAIVSIVYPQGSGRAVSHPALGEEKHWPLRLPAPMSGPCSAAQSLRSRLWGGRLNPCQAGGRLAYPLTTVSQN